MGPPPPPPKRVTKTMRCPRWPSRGSSSHFFTSLFWFPESQSDAFENVDAHPRPLPPLLKRVTKAMGLPCGGRPSEIATRWPSRGSSSSERRVCSRTLCQPPPSSFTLYSKWCHTISVARTVFCLLPHSRYEFECMAFRITPAQIGWPAQSILFRLQ